MGIIQGGRVTPGVSRDDLFRRFKFVLDATSGIAVGTVNLTDEGGEAIGLPDKFIVKGVLFHDVTAFTSGGGATISLGTTGAAAAILAATAISASPFNAANALLAGTTTPFRVSNAGNPVNLTATIAVAALTAGRLEGFIDGYAGE